MPQILDPPSKPPPGREPAGEAWVLGARSHVRLAATLSARGWRGALLTRRHEPGRPAPRGFVWRELSDPRWRVPPEAVVFSLMPLDALPPWLPRCRQAAGIVALGTTSVHVREASADADERARMARLREAETYLAEFGAAARVPWTLLRPTLIYGDAVDGNLGLVRRVVERVGVFPVAAPGSGLRQPVHEQDVAAAMLAAARHPALANRAVDLPGPETLRYREMVARVFAASGRKPRVPALPPGVLRAGLRLLRRLGAGGLSPTLVDRMNVDQCFDAAGIWDTLGLAPRPFRPGGAAHDGMPPEQPRESSGGG